MELFDWKLIACGVLLGALLGGCTRTEPAPEARPIPEAVPAEIDVESAIARVRASFRPFSDGLVSQGRGFEATALEDGSFSLVATHVPTDGRVLASRALRVRTSSSVAVNAARASVKQRADGSAEIDRGFALERWSNDGDSVEQTWTFAQAPQGTADVQVRVQFEGHVLAGKTEHGWHLRDSESGLGFRYGNATWVDADGKRTAVTVAAARDTLVLTVPRALLASSSYPAVLDPVIVPEFGMDQPVQVTPSTTHTNAKIADNSLRLVVWEDLRANLDGLLDRRLYAARIGSDRTLFDPAGIELDRISVSSQFHPEVAASPDGFLVTWVHYGSAGTQTDIHSINVDQSGVLSNRRILDGSAGQQTLPSVAWDGQQYVVVWMTYTGPSTLNDLRYTRLSSSGATLAAAQSLIAGAGDQSSPVVAAVGGSHTLVAWTDDRTGTPQIFGTRISLDGTVLDVGGRQVSSSAFFAGYASIAPGTLSTPSLVVWQDYADSENTDLYARRWLGDGGLLDATPIVISGDEESATAPVAAFSSNGSGGRFIVFWSSSPVEQFEYTLKARIVETDGGVQAPFDVIPSQQGSAIASDALGQINGAWVLYNNQRLGFGSADPIYLRPVFTTGAAGSTSTTEVPVVATANAQRHSAVASSGADYFIVWEDARSIAGRLDLWGTRINAQGTVLDPAGIPLAQTEVTEQSPAVAYGAGQYLVTWRVESASLAARRVSVDGGVLDAEPLAVTPGATVVFTPDVAFDGENFAIVATRNGPVSGRHVRVWRVSPEGTLLDGTGIELSEPNFYEFNSTIASRGDGRSLVMWNHRSSMVARFLEDGTPGELMTLLPDGGTSAEYDVVPADGGYVLAWVTEALGQIRVGRLSEAGEFSGGADLATVAGVSQSDPTLAPGGRYPLLAWEETFDGGVSTRWGWLSGQGAAMATPPGIESVPHARAGNPAAASAGGRVLLAYERMDDDAGVSAVRVKGILIQSGLDNGNACTHDNQCESGFCTEGVCCNSACGGADATDCQTCLAAAGASADGTCTLLPDTTVCRAGSGACDVAERCSGTSAACPADEVATVNTPCRDAAGACDVAEVCDGAAKSCPEDALSVAGTVCREAAACNPEEVCSGDSVACPNDAIAEDGTACSEGFCSQGACSRPRSFYSCTTAPGGPAAVLGLLWVAARLTRRLRARRPGAEDGARFATGSQGEAGERGGAPCEGEGALRMVLSITLLAGVMSASPVRAATPAPAAAVEGEVARLAFLGVSASSGVAPDVATAASEFVQSELVGLKAYRVTGPSEISTLLGLERQKQLLGCGEDSAACLAEIGGALDAERAITGTLSKVGDSMLFNLVLMDLKKNVPLHRVGRRMRGGNVDAVLDEVRPMLLELIASDPRARKPQVAQGRTGPIGLVAGVRGETDVLSPAVVPAITASYRWQALGAAVAFIPAQQFGFRAEARYMPLELGIARPYVGLGATAFLPAVAGRIALGSAFQVGPVQLSADVAYERFFNADFLQAPNSVVVAAGAGWLF